MFEKITKGTITASDVMNFSDTLVAFIESDTKQIAQLRGCLTGEEEEAKANAEFIAYCFNLQQRFDIGAIEEVVSVLEFLMKGVDGLPPLSAIAGVLSEHYTKAGAALVKIQKS